MQNRQPDDSDITDDNVAAIYIPIEDILRNPLNPRGEVKPEDVTELTESIKKHGVLEPLIVDFDCRIIAGERRYVAAQLAGIDRIPVIFRDATDVEVRELALVENLQREDLKPITEAKAYADLLAQGQSIIQIANRIGIRKDKIQRMLRLLKLPANIQDAVESQELSIDAGLALLKIENVITQKVIANKAISENMTTADIREEIGLNPHKGSRKTKTSDERQSIIINHALDAIEKSVGLLGSLDGYEPVIKDLQAIQERILNRLISENRKVKRPVASITREQRGSIQSSLAVVESVNTDKQDKIEYLIEAGWTRHGNRWRDSTGSKNDYTLDDAVEIQSKQ